MTKTELQKELLEKVKPGTKPSDIKKQKIRPKSPEMDEGYSSEEEEKNIPTKQIKELQKQVNYYSNLANNHLKNLQLAQAKITNLEEQLKRKPKSIPVKSESEQITEKNKQIEIIAKENEKNIEKVKKLEEQERQWKEVIQKSNTLIADKDQIIGKHEESIKDLQAKNQNLNKTIEELKKQVKIKENDKGDIKELFDCYNCKNQQQISLLVLELPEGKLCQPCWSILRKKTKENIKPTPKENKPFTCHTCQETKKDKEYKVKLDATLIEYSICSTCLPLIKEYNEKEDKSDRELDIWE